MAPISQASTVSATYNSGTEVPVVANGYAATGNTVDFTLNFAPQAGMELMVVKNTGLDFIQGAFAGLAQGQTVALTYGGISYRFIVNYYGGTGNDLVLQWAATRPVGWGYNLYGQIGDESTTDRMLPVDVFSTGLLLGRQIVAMSARRDHILALCADGTVAAWGFNNNGQLGNNTTADSPVPVGVVQNGVLAGKMVVAVSAGANHSLALCSDGTVAAWGYNAYGQLGNNTTTDSKIPVAVDTSGVLSGKVVTAVSAGGEHNLALCSDGTVVAWGDGTVGAGNSSVPVVVNASGALAGKTVVVVKAGSGRSLALCSDGTVASWDTNGSTPIAVNTTGVLSGKVVVELAPGAHHTLALCSDGTVAVWGLNYSGQLGDGTTSYRSEPVAVNTSGALLGKVVVAITAGLSHSLARCSDGTLVAWGENAWGQLGIGSTADSLVPVTVSSSALGNGERYAAVFSGSLSHSSLGLVGLPPIPSASKFEASNITKTGATLNGNVNPNGSPATAYFEYGQDTSYGSSAYVSLNPNDSVIGQNVNAILTDLVPGAIYHYRLVVANALSTVSTTDGVFAASRDVSASYSSASEIPITASAFAASGATFSATLNFAPATGTNLLVVNNTGPGSIEGTFDNLAQGQMISLNYNGTNYRFVANYYGGTGNDLVLQWAYVRPVAWGDGSWGKLGDGDSSDNLVPGAINISSVLAGKTVIGLAAGVSHSLALCSDGTLTAWGLNDHGSFGNGTTISSYVPVLTDQSGVLAGKHIVALEGGSSHSLALASDGTLVTWGSNSDGQLGNNTLINSNVPVLVDRSGVLANKKVTLVSTNSTHSLALCADGTLAAWGNNFAGQLGNNRVTDSNVPVLVDRSGVLAGRTIIAVAAGSNYSMALCSDGTVAAWGYNGSGQLGNNTTTDSKIPVAVNQSGALAGRTVVAITAGSSHSLALCSDGTVVAWGYNAAGQLGNGTTTNAIVPVAINQSGALAGKTVVGIAGGLYHSLARCSDGTIATWGTNSDGQLVTNNTSDSSVPVIVNTSTLGPGERLTEAGERGAAHHHNLGIVAMPLPPPTTTTLAATSVGTTSVTLNGTVNANDNSTTVSFDYGFATSYGSSMGATPLLVSGTGMTAVSASVTGLNPGTTYHYRITGTSPVGTTHGSDLTFRTINTDASLSNLVLTSGVISPVFASDKSDYTASTSNTSLTVIPTAADSAASVLVNGVAVTSGSPSAVISLAQGPNIVMIVVTAEDGVTMQTYTVSVTRAPLTWTYTSAADIPDTASSYTASGSVNLSLGFEPSAGTVLTVVRTTGPSHISGAFSNLTQGQPVALSYNGQTYNFVADYYGGTGNDLVLRWTNVRSMAWGSGSIGRLGNGGTTNSSVPVAVLQTGVLAGKTVKTLAAGGNYCLALCADGSLATWGSNGSGQLGNSSFSSSSVPVAVQQTSGILANKVVVAIAAGGSHSLVLCSDGTLAAWGSNGSGQLGNNGFPNSSVPVAVLQTSGLLANKVVVAIAAGGSHSLALCSDGTLAAWGSNSSGQLGNNGFPNSSVPVAVLQTSGILAGKAIIAIAAGGSHSLALCSDGTLAAWGSNSSGQLGNNSFSNSSVPVAVLQTSGILSGKTVVTMAAGSNHSVALCSDGTVTAWGSNSMGQLGNNTTTDSKVPVAVNQSGALAGRTVVTVSAGSLHSLALCSDGSLATWGANSAGQLGNGSTTNINVPATVSTATLTAGERFLVVSSGSSATHTVALVAAPRALAATTLAAGSITTTGATLNGTVNTSGGSAAVFFDYGLNTSYGSTVSAVPTPVTGNTGTAVSANVSNLTPNTTYYYRVRAVTVDETVSAAGMAYTTLPPDVTGPTGGTMTLTPVSPVDAGAALTVVFANWTDASGPLAYSVLIDDVVVSAQQAPASRSISAPLTSGTHSLKGQVFDAVGNISEVMQSFTVIVTQADWRMFYFGSPENAGDGADLADPDGDGYNNLFEYVSGLVPTSALSRFNLRVERVAGQSGHSAIIFSPRVDGRTYTVKYKQSLTDATWTELSDISTNDNGAERIITDLSAGSENRFYRVELIRP